MMANVFLHVFITSIIVSFVSVPFIIWFNLKRTDSLRIENFFCTLMIMLLLIPLAPNIYMPAKQYVSRIYQDSVKLKKDNNANITVGEHTNAYTDTADAARIQNTASSTQYQTVDMKERLFPIILKYASYMWISSILIILLVYLVSLLKFKIVIKRDRISVEKLQSISDNLREKLNIKSNISVYISSHVDSPCIFGIFKPCIYISQNIFKYNTDFDIEYILTHELMHYKRHDIFSNFLSIIALCIHFFNPLIWRYIKKFKEYREYACDISVLEFFGEEKYIDYGMTLINLSRICTNKSNYINWALCFESTNMLKGRIEMIKNFKKGSYKLSVKAVCAAFLAVTSVLSCNVYASTLDTKDTSSAASSSTENEPMQNKHQFLIDDNMKCYNNIDKLKKVMDYDFKLPDYTIDNAKFASFQLCKISDTENYLRAYFNNQKNDTTYSIVLSKSDCTDAIRAYKNIVTSAVSDNVKSIEINSEDKTIDNIKGKTFTVTTTYKGNENKELVDKYFEWKDNDLYYAINYVKDGKENPKLSDSEISKVANSLVDSGKNVNVDYNYKESEPNTEIAVMPIYDKDDVKEAESYIGFSPKFGLNYDNDNIKIRQAVVNMENTDKKSPLYGLDAFYDYADGSITYTQSKYSNDYDNIVKTGYKMAENYVDNTTEKLKVEKINIDGTDVYRYSQKPFDKYSEYSMTYEWKRDDIYYSCDFFSKNEIQNKDDVVKEFINSKEI